MLLAPFFRQDLLDQIIVVRLAIHEIDIRDVDNNQRRLVVRKEILVVRFNELIEILFLNRLFVVESPFSDMFHQNISGGLQKNHEIRLHQIGIQERVDLLIEKKFLFIEVERGEDTI